MPHRNVILPPAMPPRHHTLVVLLCGFLALTLDVVALVSPSWVTSDHFSQSLWEMCSCFKDAWYCSSVLHSGWQVAALVLVFGATLILGLWFVVSVLWICYVKQPLRFRSLSLLLLVAVLLQVSTLMLFPLWFLPEPSMPRSSQFGWGYGVGWGSCIFMIGGIVLSCLRTDIPEV
ncbi:transmembrane protein 47-like [Bombina bombina]|uniref:transmembrane protein 47-like n=1 Tax=Bombina bombina TaxID=8345 RepID=UPI00235A68EC|nr:transmembrane protein 47-like [Bombina bombina]